MFCIISIVFGVIGLLILFLYKVVAAHSSFFNEHKNVFYVAFAMAFVFLYNYCVNDYRQSNILYVLVNVIFIVLFVLADKITNKN